MARAFNDRGAFRCVVPPENSAARLLIGYRSYPVSVLDTSRCGFNVKMPNRIAGKLKNRKILKLSFAGETWEVSPASQYCEDEATTLIGFTRIQELTKFNDESSWGVSFLPKADLNADPSFLFYMVIAILIACICLPGVGDSLGTAPKVRKGITDVFNQLSGH